MRSKAIRRTRQRVTRCSVPSPQWLIVGWLILVVAGCTSPPPTPPPEPDYHEGIRIEFGMLWPTGEGWVVSPTRMISMRPSPEELHGFLVTPPDDLEHESYVVVTPPAVPGTLRGGFGDLTPEEILSTGMTTVTQSGPGPHLHYFAFDPGDPTGWWKAQLYIDGELAAEVAYEVLAPKEAAKRIASQEHGKIPAVRQVDFLAPPPGSQTIRDPELGISVTAPAGWSFIETFDSETLARSIRNDREAVPDLDPRHYRNKISLIRFMLRLPEEGLTFHGMKLPTDPSVELTLESLGASEGGIQLHGETYYIRPGEPTEIGGREFLSATFDDAYGNLRQLHYFRQEGDTIIALVADGVGRKTTLVTHLLEGIRFLEDEDPSP